jgi:hypothetical protein
MRDADNWSSAKEGVSDFSARTPPPIVSPRGNYYLGALTVKLRRPLKPRGSATTTTTSTTTNSSSSQPTIATSNAANNSSMSFFEDSDEELEIEDDG